MSIEIEIKIKSTKVFKELQYLIDDLMYHMVVLRGNPNRYIKAKHENNLSRTLTRIKKIDRRIYKIVLKNIDKRIYIVRVKTDKQIQYKNEMIDVEL